MEGIPGVAEWLGCLDPTAHSHPQSVGAAPCLQTMHHQQWRLTHGSSIRQDDFCLHVEPGDRKEGGMVKQKMCLEGKEDSWERLSLPNGKLGGHMLRLRGSNDICILKNSEVPSSE